MPEMPKGGRSGSPRPEGPRSPNATYSKHNEGWRSPHQGKDFHCAAPRSSGVTLSSTHTVSSRHAIFQLRRSSPLFTPFMNAEARGDWTGSSASRNLRMTFVSTIGLPLELPLPGGRCFFGPILRYPFANLLHQTLPARLSVFPCIGLERARQSFRTSRGNRREEGPSSLDRELDSHALSEPEGVPDPLGNG